MHVVLFVVTKPLMKNPLTFPPTPIRYMEMVWEVVIEALGKIERAGSQIMSFSVVLARVFVEEGALLKYWERKVGFAHQGEEIKDRKKVRVCSLVQSTREKEISTKQKKAQEQQTGFSR